MKRIILPGPETERMQQSAWELMACLKVNSYCEMYEMHPLERLHWKVWAVFPDELQPLSCPLKEMTSKPTFPEYFPCPALPHLMGSESNHNYHTAGCTQQQGQLCHLIVSTLGQDTWI